LRASSERDVGSEAPHPREVCSMSKNVRVRFAPSPTGHLHVGGARTALFNWLFAKRAGGSFVLRIEDTDAARSTAESERAVLEDLRWLRLDWDEGPDVGGEFGPYRQSERLAIYRAYADRLLAGGRAFLCYCTDSELDAKRKAALAEGRDPRYDGTCRDLTDERRRVFESEGRVPVVRFRTGERDVTVNDLVRGRVEFGREMLGDFVLLRGDGRPTYNFAVVVDDALMEITHVIRAEEHLPNTMRQLLVYEALGFSTPVFAHVSLIVDKKRSKLSKRRGATSVSEFREQGYLPGALLNYLALLGWSPADDTELFTREELVRAFDLSRVSPSPAAFDEDKLDWVNGHHIREEPLARVAELSRGFASAAGLEEPDDARFEAIVDLVRPRLDRLSDLPDAVRYFFDQEWGYEPGATEALRDPGAERTLRELLDVVSTDAGALISAAFKQMLKSAGESCDVRGKKLYAPVRAALTGTTHGPGLGEIAELLGRDRVRARLARAVATFDEGGAHTGSA
jgi:nondiscriminating glutamyl-tRNA synthetase